jgi:hypothetical protein
LQLTQDRPVDAIERVKQVSFRRCGCGGCSGSSDWCTTNFCCAHRFIFGFLLSQCVSNTFKSMPDAISLQAHFQRFSLPFV